MKESIDKIIIAVLTGKDYRPYVLETINRRFLDNVQNALIKIFEARQRNSSPDWWERELVSGSKDVKDILWFGGLNKKTIISMEGTAKKEVCLRVSKLNLKTFDTLLHGMSLDRLARVEIKIIYRGKTVFLSEKESLFLLNTIGAIRLTLQGGAWSEVGKKAEKRLLFIVFEMLGIPQENYVLVFGEMMKREIAGKREIDAIVYTDDKKILKVELKLLAGNPEVGDEAFSRGVELFLVDRLSETMIEDGKRHGVTVIEFRNQDALTNIYNFFKASGVTVKKPDIKNIPRQVKQLSKQYDEERHKFALLQKAKLLLAPSKPRRRSKGE